MMNDIHSNEYLEYGKYSYSYFNPSFHARTSFFKSFCRYTRERNVRNEARDDPENSRRRESGDIGRRAPSLESVTYSRVCALCSFHRCSSVRKYHRCK